MTKRLCPFKDDYISQSKVHLTKKGFEKTNAKAMENIWNKTRDLLFEGAKKSMGRKADTTEPNEQCDFCQKWFSSPNECVKCHQFYCTDCSMINYKEEVTEFICLSCA